MKKRINVVKTSCMAIILGLACSATGAQDLGSLGGKVGGMLSGGSMSSGSMGNVAGLLQYCVKNNYLGGSSGASGIKDQLLGKMGGTSGSSDSSENKSSSASGLLGKLTGGNNRQASNGDSSSDPSYLSGAKGILQTGNGQSISLPGAGGGSSDMKSQITKKVCDTVLKQGKSFL